MPQAATLFATPRALLRGALRTTSALGLALALFATPALAGELTFGGSWRLETNSNPDRNDSTDDTATRFISRPSVSYVTETPAARFELGATATLRRTLEGSTARDGFTDPRVFFDYARSAADASFGLSGSVVENDLVGNREIDDFDTNGGVRRTTDLGFSLDLREDAPFGIGLSGGQTRVTYSDNGGAQSDYTRSRLGLTTRLDINPVTRATFGLRYDVFDAEDALARETWGFDAGLTRDRPLGRSSLTLGVTDTPGGTRSSLSFGHSFDTPLGTQNLRLGVTRTATGDLSTVGGFDLSYDLPNGGLTASLDRRVTSDQEDDSEVVLTRARASWNHALSPLASLRFDLSFAESEDSTDTTANTELGATYSRELTSDWSMDLGVRHRQQRREVGADNSSNTAFIELRRSLSLRF